jgi:hypothetical protein
MKNFECFLKNHIKMTMLWKNPHTTESVPMMIFIHDGNGLHHVDNIISTWMVNKSHKDWEKWNRAKTAFSFWKKSNIDMSPTQQPEVKTCLGLNGRAKKTVQNCKKLKYPEKPCKTRGEGCYR